VLAANASHPSGLHGLGKRRIASMTLKSKRRELQAVNGAVGLVVGLGGFVGHLYSPAMAPFLMLAIWIVGATLINLLTDRPNKS
jgi:hypothetical protein